MEPGQNIADRLLAFGIASEAVARQLPTTAPGRHVSTQLVKAASAAGANYEEARAPESRADFIHKISIALKETREARYWLNFVNGAGMATVEPNLLDEARQLVAILTASKRNVSTFSALPRRLAF
jgi:four helix bundle protein